MDKGPEQMYVSGLVFTANPDEGDKCLGACPRMPFFPNSSLFRKNNARR